MKTRFSLVRIHVCGYHILIIVFYFQDGGCNIGMYTLMVAAMRRQVRSGPLSLVEIHLDTVLLLVKLIVLLECTTLGR